MADDLFELEIVVRGPERTIDGSYGPRTDRDTHARLEIPITGDRAWLIYQEAIAKALAPEARITLPPPEFTA